MTVRTKELKWILMTKFPLPTTYPWVVVSSHLSRIHRKNYVQECWWGWSDDLANAHGTNQLEDMLTIKKSKHFNHCIVRKTLGLETFIRLLLTLLWQLQLEAYCGIYSTKIFLFLLWNLLFAAWLNRALLLFEGRKIPRENRSSKAFPKIVVVFSWRWLVEGAGGSWNEVKMFIWLLMLSKKEFIVIKRLHTNLHFHIIS